MWEEITKRGAVQRPLMDTVLLSELTPGSPFRYLSPNGKYGTKMQYAMFRVMMPFLPKSCRVEERR